MANGYPIDGNGQRVILGMAPARYDRFVIARNLDGTIDTITYYYDSVVISVTHLTYDISANLETGYVAAS